MDLLTAKKLLLEENLTCVLVSAENVYKSELRGVAPLLKLIEENIDVSGFCAADKVIGKGSALLFVLCKVSRVHACVLSKAGEEVFLNEGIIYTYDKLVDGIVNRAGDGLCPIESAVIEIDSPKEAYEVIKSEIAKLKK